MASSSSGVSPSTCAPGSVRRICRVLNSQPSGTITVAGWPFTRNRNVQYNPLLQSSEQSIRQRPPRRPWRYLLVP
jgi:hypothetical protein